MNLCFGYSRFSPLLSPEVYDDVSAPHAPLSGGTDPSGALSSFDCVHSLVRAQRIHLSTAAVSLVMACVQLLKNLDFHPRMGLVSRTIAHAAKTMSFFLVLFFAVVVVFALFGVILYGRTMDKFSTIFVSFESLLEILIGEFEQVKLDMVAV